MKEISKKIVAGALIPTLLLPSCSSYFSDAENIEEINKQEGLTESNINDIAVPINLNLSSEDCQYLTFLKKLTADITKNPLIAERFAKDPEAFLASYGISDMKISLDDSLLKLVLALGDKEIINSIEQNDISRFLSLCSDKGIITELSEADSSKIDKIISNNRELQTQYLNPSTRSLGVVGAAVAAVIGISVAGGISLIVIEVSVFSGSGDGPGGPEYSSMYTMTRNNSNTPFQVFALKKDKQNAYIMLAEYQEKIVNQYVNTLLEKYPEQMKGINIEKLKTFIAINIFK